MNWADFLNADSDAKVSDYTNILLSNFQMPGVHYSYHSYHFFLKIAKVYYRIYTWC